MPPISIASFAPLDEAACARRQVLQQRMRILAAGSAVMLAGIGTLSFQAYLEHGVGTGLALLVMGCVFLFEAARQADHRFVAPLQALCQEDYSRQVELVLGPLLTSPSRRRIAATLPASLAQHIDA